jgi:methylated-DNA-protein-cysteine methyltransferase-like protein
LNNKFDQAIWKVVSNIPVGQVKAYGEVARAAGYPKRARMVSKAMGRSPEPLPWYRVVKSDRSLAFEIDSSPYQKQAKRLKEEGVKLRDGKVIPLVSDKNKSLDEAIWGPRD